MKKLLILLVIIFLFSNVQAGNDSRTGTYGFIELLFSPSAKASGMGEGGTASVHAKSFYYNPGSLGLFALEDKLIFSGYTKKAQYVLGIEYYNGLFSVPIHFTNENSKFKFAVGGYYSTTDFGTFDMDGEAYEAKFKNYNATLSVGYFSRVQIGAGFTFKIIKENLFESSQDAAAFDIGMIARYPIEAENTNLYCSPIFGIAISNLGSDVEADGLGIDGGSRPFRNTTISKLPKKKSVGLSFEFGLTSDRDENENFSLVSILPTYEITKFMDHDWYPIYGLEIGIAEMFYYRAGKNNALPNGWSDEKNSNGYSISSRGIFKLLQSENSTKSTRSGINKFFTDHFAIEYSYANSLIMKSYHEIIVTFSIND